MEIIPYEPELAPRVAVAYNSLVAGLPHCYPTTPERVAAVLDGSERPGHDNGRLHGEQAWVGTAGGEVLGFAQAAVEDPAEAGHHPRGVLRFLAYEPGQRALGQDLLDCVSGYFADREMREVVAFHQDHIWPCYHLTHAFLSDRLTHVHALLEYNGFQRSAGEVFLDWPEFAPPVPPATPLEFETRCELQSGATARPGFGLLALRGEELLAQCWSASCGDRAPGSAAEDWCLTTWLQVEEPYRGSYLGANLLALALGEMRELGYRHAAISTTLTNYRAQLFYSNLGYRTSDWTYALTRTT